MNRPAVAVAFAYAAGLLLAQLFHPPPTTLFGASILVLVLVLVLALVLGKLRWMLIWPALALIGWTNFSIHTTAISPHDLRTLLGQEPALVTIRGTLTETPNLRIFTRDDQTLERSVARVNVSSLRRTTNWQPATGSIVVTTPGATGDKFFVGQPVEINGVIAPPDTPVAEGMFDYRSHLEKLSIHYALKAGSTNDWRLGAEALEQPPFSGRFIAWAKRTLTLGLDPADKATQLLLAMTLGQKTVLTDEVSESFMRSGTMHIFAISGLHIALIAGILLALLRVAQLPRSVCGLVVLPLIWFYTGATGWQPSAIRSTIMMSVIIGGWSLKRPSDLLNSLAAAGLIILVWDPQQLFQASFQLSFFVVLSIALFSPPLNKIRDRLLQTDPLLPRELIPRWRRWLGEPLRLVATCFTTSLAAWLGSLPLTAYYFHLFSPVTLLANLVIVPLSSFALMANLGALVCGQWLSWLTDLFNNAAWFFMLTMTRVSDWAVQIPGAYFYVPAPSLVTLGFYYAVFITIFSGWLKTTRRQFFGAGILALVAAVYCWQWQATRDETHLTVLPLNGGHAVWVDAAGKNHDWLVNCGSEEAVGFTLKNFLHAQGVNHIPRLLLTEGNVRNIGGALELDKLFGVGAAWTGNTKFRSSPCREIIAKFDKPPARHRILHCGETNGCWQVLHPGADDNFPKADDNALVLLGNFHGTRILLLSDLGRAGQNALLARTNDLHADIVIAGLPGDWEPLGNALIDASQPRVIIIADSEHPATRRASLALHERLAAKKIPVIYTRTADAVTIVTKSNGWELRTMDGQKFSSLP